MAKISNVISNYYVCYKAYTSLGEHTFVVPYKDMGNTEFEEQISAQLLIRWLQ